MIKSLLVLVLVISSRADCNTFMGCCMMGLSDPDCSGFCDDNPLDLDCQQLYCDRDGFPGCCPKHHFTDSAGSFYDNVCQNYCNMGAGVSEPDCQCISGGMTSADPGYDDCKHNLCVHDPVFAKCCLSSDLSHPDCSLYCDSISGRADPSCVNLKCTADPSYASCCRDLPGGIDCTNYCPAHSTDPMCEADARCPTSPTFADCCHSLNNPNCSLHYCPTNPSDSVCNCLASPYFPTCCSDQTSETCRSFCAATTISSTQDSCKNVRCATSPSYENCCPISYQPEMGQTDMDCDSFCIGFGRRDPNCISLRCKSDNNYASCCDNDYNHPNCSNYCSSIDPSGLECGRDSQCASGSGTDYNYDNCCSNLRKRYCQAYCSSNSDAGCGCVNEKSYSACCSDPTAPICEHYCDIAPVSEVRCLSYKCLSVPGFEDPRCDCIRNNDFTHCCGSSDISVQACGGDPLDGYKGGFCSTDGSGGYQGGSFQNSQCMQIICASGISDLGAGFDICSGYGNAHETAFCASETGGKTFKCCSHLDTYDSCCPAGEKDSADCQSYCSNHSGTSECLCINNPTHPSCHSGPPANPCRGRGRTSRQSHLSKSRGRINRAGNGNSGPSATRGR